VEPRVDFSDDDDDDDNADCDGDVAADDDNDDDDVVGLFVVVDVVDGDDEDADVDDVVDDDVWLGLDIGVGNCRSTSLVAAHKKIKLRFTTGYFQHILAYYEVKLQFNLAESMHESSVILIAVQFHWKWIQYGTY